MLAATPCLDCPHLFSMYDPFAVRVKARRVNKTNSYISANDTSAKIAAMR
jgi:hypothetical protein